MRIIVVGVFAFVLTVGGIAWLCSTRSDTRHSRSRPVTAMDAAPERLTVADTPLRPPEHRIDDQDHFSHAFHPAIRGNLAATAPVDSEALKRALARVAAFENWVGTWRDTDPSERGTLTSRGHSLAANRRAALKDLIAINPRLALSVAVPAGIRPEFPVEVRSELEHWIDARGDFEVIISCGGTEHRIDRWVRVGEQRYRAFVFGRRETQGSKRGLPVHGIAIDGVFVLDEMPFRILDEDERAERGIGARTIGVLVGDELRIVKEDDAPEKLRATLVRAESQLGPYIAPEATHEADDKSAAVDNDPATAAAPPGWTVGQKRVLYIKVDFPDDPGTPIEDNDIMATMTAADRFFQDVSNGRCSLTTTIFPAVLRMSHAKKSPTYENNDAAVIRDETVRLARDYDRAHGGTGAFDPDRYDRWVVIHKRIVGRSGGVGHLGSAGIELNGAESAWAVIHELGHNHGLSHSHAWRVASGVAPSSSAGRHIEHGDPFDVMGWPVGSPPHFNAVQKEILGYLDASTVTTVTQPGIFRIHRHDHHDSSGVQAIKIPIGTSYDYRIEYRRSTHSNAFRSPRLQNGVGVLWGKGPAFTAGSSPWGNGPHLLDMTPGSIESRGMETSDLWDAQLALGETFTDPTSGIRVTPLSTGGASPREYIDVRVDFGAVAGNRDPMLQTNSPTKLVARTDLLFMATASDPDGDLVDTYWKFGDTRVHPSRADVSQRWLIGGKYTVKARVVDAKGGSSEKSFAVDVIDPLLSWTRRNVATTPALYDVIYAGGRFIAAGKGILLSSDATVWNPASRPASIQDISYGLAFGGGRYVAVGVKANPPSPTYVGSAIFSEDGQTWQAAGLPPGAPWLVSVAYGMNRFVAVGNNGKAFASIDGVVWNEVTTGVTADLKRVRFANGLFVAVGDSSSILTSGDGISWSRRSPTSVGALLQDLAYHGGRWVASGLGFNGIQVLTSTDGVTWSNSMLPVPGNYSRLGVGYGALLALGTYDQDDSNATIGKMAVTEAADVWSVSRTVGTVGEIFTAFAEGNGTAVIVGYYNNIQRGAIYQVGLRSTIIAQPQTQSFDGRTVLTLSVGIDNDFGASYQWYKDGVAIAGANNVTLTVANNGPATEGSYTVTVTNSGGRVTSDAAVVTISNRSPTIQATAATSVLAARTDITFTTTATDPDGDRVTVSWDFGDGTAPVSGTSVTRRWLKGGTYTVKVTAHDGKGGSATEVFEVTINDPLISWTRRASDLAANWLTAVAYGGNRFVVVGRSGEILFSEDGVSWNRPTNAPAFQNHLDVAFGGGRFVSVGNGSSNIYHSVDGRMWEPGSVPTHIPVGLLAVAYGAGRFVAVGADGKAVTSSDGVTWANAATGVSATLWDVRFMDNRFVAVSSSLAPLANSSAVVLTSADGLAWTVHNVPDGVAWNQTSLARHAGRWYTTSSGSFTTGSTPFWSSSDGATWTKSATNIPVLFSRLNTAAGALVALGSKGQIVFTDNAREWAMHAVGESTEYYVDIAEGNGTVVLVGHSDFTTGLIYQSVAAPVISTQPLAQKFDRVGSVTLTVTVLGAIEVTYQWSKDGVAIAGATAATLNLFNDGGSAGTYTVAVSNRGGSVTSNPAIVTAAAPNPGRLVNLAIRTHAGTGAQALIMGVVLGGANTSGSKPVLIRGVGPALGAFGVPGFIADPTLTVIQGSTNVVFNDNWGGTTALQNAFKQVGAFPFDAASRDASALLSLAPGSYTVQINGVGGATGVALAEIYDATIAEAFTLATPRLVNVSARTQIGGADVFTAGFVVGGATSKTVLIRAIGPTLGAFGVDDALADPKVELYSGSTLLNGNDDWGGTAALAGAFAQVGAFLLEPGSKDAALLVTLQPGSYTVQVTGVGGAGGVALVELYDVP